MNQEDIRNSIQKEFEFILKLSSNQIYSKQRLDNTKNLLNDIIPSEIKSRANDLIEVIINYQLGMIEDSIELLDSNLQEAYYNKDIPNKIRDWAKQTENTLRIDPQSVQYSNDPRNIHALKSSAIPFLAGSGITAIVWHFDPTKKISLIVGGLATTAATAYTFKIAFDKAEPLARKQIERDVKEYLKNAEQQMINWLLSVSDKFVEEFEKFCNENSISFEGEDNP